MSLPDLLENWRATPTIAGNIAAWRTLPPRSAETAPWPPDLHPALTEALHARGITELYVHQVAAWEHINDLLIRSKYEYLFNFTSVLMCGSFVP